MEEKDKSQPKEEKGFMDEDEEVLTKEEEEELKE